MGIHKHIVLLLLHHQTYILSAAKWQWLRFLQINVYFSTENSEIDI